jgi:hypothetical protein
MADRRRALLVAAACALLLGGLGGARAAAARSTGAAIVVPASFAVAAWSAESDNLVPAVGTITFDGVPVSGALVRVDGYVLPARSDANGRFVYFVDDTLIARHLVSVTDASGAHAGNRTLTKDEQSALEAKHAAITVAYPLRDLRTSHDAAGRTIVEGVIGSPSGPAPLRVSLYSYELTGTVTDANGKPVVGARVSTRTLDRDYWTVSSPTDARGRYSSLFTASDEVGHNPVPFTIRVSKGDLVYQYLPQEFVQFAPLHSARMDLRLPPRGYPMLLPLPRSYPGAIYEGIVVGAAQGDAAAVRPIRVTWPDARGRFRIVLPSSLRGRMVSLWEGKVDLFSTAAAQPGRAVGLRDWPTLLAAGVPRDLARMTVR